MKLLPVSPLSGLYRGRDRAYPLHELQLGAEQEEQSLEDAG